MAYFRFFLSVDVAPVSSLVGLLTTERIRVFGKSSNDGKSAHVAPFDNHHIRLFRIGA